VWSLDAGTPIDAGSPPPLPSDAATRAARCSGVRRPPAAPPASAGAAVLVATPPPPPCDERNSSRAFEAWSAGRGPRVAPSAALALRTEAAFALARAMRSLLPSATRRSKTSWSIWTSSLMLDPLGAAAGYRVRGTGSYRGPEMPPSLRIRQKWTARKMTVTNGMNSTCSTYQRSSVLGPISSPPSSTNWTWSPNTGV
jgi:hypothetical protein